MIKVWHVGNFPNGKEVKRHRKAKGIINYDNHATAPQYAQTSIFNIPQFGIRIVHKKSW